MKLKVFFKSEIGKFTMLVFVVSIFYLIYVSYQNYKERMLVSSKQTFAILDDVRNSNRGDEIDFHFKDSSGKTVEITNFTHNFDCSNSKKGDTITIKYSLINSEYVDLIHCYYNPAKKQ